MNPVRLWMNAIFMLQTLQTEKGRYLGCTINILMVVSLLFFNLGSSYDIFINKISLSVLSEGVGQLHFMNNEKNDVNNAVPLFGCGSRLAEAGAPIVTRT